MKPIYKEMLVWHGFEEKAVKRFVLHENEDGSCAAVGCGAESNFKDGCPFRVVSWNHCKEIPKKKRVLMTHLDMFKLSKEGALFIDAADGITTYWNNFRNTEVFKYSLDWEEKGLDNCTWLEPYKEVEE